MDGFKIKIEKINSAFSPLSVNMSRRKIVLKLGAAEEIGSVFRVATLKFNGFWFKTLL